MCTSIFAAKSLKDQWKVGFDPFVEWIGREDEIEKNMGEGKALPLGPETIFNGKPHLAIAAAQKVEAYQESYCK
jgi:hypothetical protein